MAEWLNFNNRDEFMNVYAVVRSQCMKRSLESLRDHSRTLSAGNTRSAASPSMLRKFSSPIVANEGTPTTANKNYVKLISKRVSKVTAQLEAATGITRRSLGINSYLHTKGKSLLVLWVTTFSPTDSHP